jgi:uncharacterized protein (TIGR02452 family)
MSGSVGVYSFPVTVLRQNEAEDYTLLEPESVQQFPLAFIGIQPCFQRTRQAQLHKKMYQAMKQKIELAFQVAEAKGHQILFLPAFGCGSNKNPPEDVAKIFLEVVRARRRMNSLHTVIFIFKEKPHKPDHVLLAFLKIFECQVVSVAEVVESWH